MTEIDIEAKLLEHGVSEGELNKFAKSPLHNAKKDVFRRIADSKSAEDSVVQNNPLILALYKVLQKEAETHWDTYFPDKPKSQLGDAAAQLLANQMLATLNITGKYKQYEEISLNRLYEDTRMRLEVGT